MSQCLETDRQADELDIAVLDRVLSGHDAVFRGRLARQMIADFTRMKAALTSRDRGVWRAAAHEVKGLAGTIGAEDLATLALIHEIALDAGSLSEARAQRDEICERIARLCTRLVQLAERAEGEHRDTG